MNKSIAALLAAGIFTATTALAGQDRLIPISANGPGQGGLVRGILPFSSPANLLYAAILGAGIYKSTDAGATWTPSNNGLGHLEVRTIRNKPGSTAVLYAPTEGGEGFYKSTDGGATWQASNTGLDCHFVRNVSVAGNAGYLLAATSCGVFRSVNEGATWAKVCPGISSNVTTANQDLSGQVLFLATNSGAYFSNDFGATCTPTTSGGPVVSPLTGPSGPIAFDIRSAGTNTYLVNVQGNGVFRTTDGGVNWLPVTGIPSNAPPLSSFGNVSTTWWVPLDGLGIYKSTDNGVNWAPDTTLNGLPWHMRFFFAGPGGTWWAATYAGIYKSTDNGANWTKVSTGLPNGHAVNLAAYVPSLASLPPENVYAPAETVYKSTDGGSTWAVSDTGLNGKLTHRAGGMTVDPNDPNTIYVSTVNYGIYKSTNAGANWAPVNAGLPSNLVNGTPDFRIAPSNSQVLYAGFDTGLGIFKSTNGGTSWTDVSTNLPIGDARFVNRPAVHPTNPDIVYISTRAGVYKSTDGGVTWLLKTPGSSTGFNIGRVEISTNNPQLLLAMTYFADALDRAYTVSGVYLSRDGGDSWIQLVGNEKITHARLVENPGGSTDAYIITNGYFDEHYSTLYKCVSLENSDSLDEQNCVEVASTPGQGRMWALSGSPGRLRAVATTTGMYRNRFSFLGPDFNNDSRADIFWSNAVSAQHWIWLMNGSRIVGEDTQGFSGVGQLPRIVGSPWTIAAFGDFNGDGKTDVLWRNTATGENYIYFMDRFTILPTEGYIRTITDQNWQIVGAGDFNDDGRSDILWRNSVTGENYIYFMNGLQIISEGYIRTVADTNWQVAGVGDFDGDLKADILWRNPASGQNYLYPMDGLTIKGTEGFLRTVPLPWTIAGLGDFNQDDKKDIVWRNTSTGENYVYPMNGTAILPTEGYLPTVPDNGWSIVGVGDFEGSGDSNGSKGVSDILWRHTSGSNYVWRMAGPTTTTSMCGSMGCTNGYLPTINVAGFGVVNK